MVVLWTNNWIHCAGHTQCDFHYQARNPIFRVFFSTWLVIANLKKNNFWCVNENELIITISGIHSNLITVIRFQSDIFQFLHHLPKWGVFILESCKISVRLKLKLNRIDWTWWLRRFCVNFFSACWLANVETSVYVLT